MLFLYTVIWTIFLFLITFPPKEFISSGIVIDNILSIFIVNERCNFVYHHIQRINALYLFYSFLPTAFIYGLNNWNQPQDMISNNVKFTLLEYLINNYYNKILCTSLLLPIGVIIYIWYSYQLNWENHIIIDYLKTYTLSYTVDDQNQYTWKDIVNSINEEFLVFDKFYSQFANQRFYITDSWVIVVDKFYLCVMHKNDVIPNLVKAKDHPLSHISNYGVQILDISLTSQHKPDMKPLIIRASSYDYNVIKESLKKPINIIGSIHIKKSLEDQFVEVFESVTKENPPYLVSDNTELDNCLGCLVKPPQCKLYKSCHSASNVSPNAIFNNPPSAPQANNDDDINVENQIAGTEPSNAQDFHHITTTPSCKMCFCRPMWCMSCMAKWFASRQDQKSPETWLLQKAPCPLCRSLFCLLDVLPLSQS